MESIKDAMAVQVWRILFWVMAGLAILTCLLTFFGAVEPRSYLPKRDRNNDEQQQSRRKHVCEKIMTMFQGVGTVFKTPSFNIILVGNIISIIIGLGLGYKIMYMQ